MYLWVPDHGHGNRELAPVAPAVSSGRPVGVLPQTHLLDLVLHGTGPFLRGDTLSRAEQSRARKTRQAKSTVVMSDIQLFIVQTSDPKGLPWIDI